MSHHTEIHHDDNHADHEEHRRLFSIGLLYVATAIFALVIHRLAGFGIVISVLTGFVLAAVLTGLVHHFK